MPKMKSNSGMKKRVKLSAKGKFRFKPAGARHRMVGDSNANRRSKRKLQVMDKSFNKNLHEMLPYA
jgi:large subunit ribosomal protein L35